MDFRQRQVLADLQRVAAAPAVPDPWHAALAPTATPETRAAAAAALLQLVLETGAPDPAIRLVWQGRAELLARPAPVRAALMNGFDLLCRQRLCDADCRPAPEDCVTHPVKDLEPALFTLVRQLTPAEIDHIARADYGNDADQHRAALSTLLADPRLAYPPADRWYPAEVVELVAHVPGAPGHVPCLAIVLLDALRTGDLHGNAEFRLGNQFREILALPEPARSVLLAAFRHLHETEPTWNPAVPAASLPQDETTLPWVSLP